MRPLWSVLIILMSAGGSVAQTASPSAANCTQAKLLVTVVDNDGTPDLTLKQTNFRAQGKGLGLKITAAKLQELTPRGIIVLDASGSMGGERDQQKWRVVQTIALGIVEAAKPEAPLALVTFSDKIQDALSFSTSKESLARTIEERKPHGRTLLFDTLSSATESFGTPALGDTMFLISDGSDNRSHKRLLEIHELLLQKQVRVFMVFIDEPPRTPADLQEREVANLAARTGGQVLPLAPRAVIAGNSLWDVSQEALANARRMGRYLYKLAGVNYQVEVQTNQAISTRTRIEIELVGTDGKKLPKRQALYPHELLPCAAVTPAK